MSVEQSDITKAAYQLESFLENCDITDPTDKTILEVGFKGGYFLDQCRQKGMHPVGLEVEKQYYELTAHRFEGIKLHLYDGLKFPVEDCSFNYVVSFQVLEHVSSIENVIKESIRVLKPGGTIYHICPNFKSFYEGHYNCLWLPFLNKALGRTYLKLIGKHSDYYEHLQIIKPKTIKKILAKYHGNIDVISLGKKEFNKQFNPSQIEKVRQPILKKILILILRFPISAKILISVIACMGCYYPMTIIIKRK